MGGCCFAISSYRTSSLLFAFGFTCLPQLHNILGTSTNPVCISVRFLLRFDRLSASVSLRYLTSEPFSGNRRTFHLPVQFPRVVIRHSEAKQICCSRKQSMGEVRNQGEGEARTKMTPHVLLITASPRGHLAPSFFWAMEVARQGILVTLVSLQAETEQIISEHEVEVRGLTSLRFLTLPRPEGVPIVPRDLVFGGLLERQFEALNVRERLAAAPEPPTFLVNTQFIQWGKKVASELQIPRYTLFLAGANLARFIQASKDLFFRDGVRISDAEIMREGPEAEMNVGEGVPIMKFREFPALAFIPPLHHKLTHDVVGDADGLLLNTYHDLEPEAISALRKFKSKPNQKFFAVGPVDPYLAKESVVDESKNSDDECLRWLDKQPDSSVVFACFGTFFGLTPRQIQDVAVGLENSKQRFLWVLPDRGESPMDGKPYADVLPAGFEERVANVGKVVKGWAPQIKVLSHPATAAFLTHCGWNSTLEAVTRAMPMIAFPGTADQQMNCRYLADKLGVAAEIRRDADNFPKPNEVERAIRQVMEGEEGKAMREKLQALHAAGVAALKSDGSTVQERHAFFDVVRNA